jgi:hypothetical protein
MPYFPAITISVFSFHKNDATYRTMLGGVQESFRRL